MQQQSSRHGACVPAGSTQHLVVATELRCLTQPHDAQRLADGALAGTRTRTRCHTGAMKRERNTDSQAARAGGVRCGSNAVAARRRFGAIPWVKPEGRLRRRIESRRRRKRLSATSNLWRGR